MKYFTGEEVKLLDKVEAQQGGIWIPATVVFIERTQESTDDLMWLLEEQPEWAKDRIAIKWDSFDEVKSLFFAHADAAKNADATILFTDTEENDELRFLSRNCAYAGQVSSR